MLSVNHIWAAYEDATILEDICVHIPEGLFIGIIGPNGAGKTTLLKIMTGIKKPARGEVLLDGRDIRTLSGRDIARVMAVVPQSSFIPPLFTAEEVVAMGRYPFSRFRFSETGQDHAAVADAIRKTGIEAFKDRTVSELSGGQRQEVIIARALAQTPKLLVLDEPTANLDIKHQMKILELASALVKKEGLAAAMVIHDLSLAARFCDRLILLHDRSVLAMGVPEEVLTPVHLKTAYEVDTVIRKNPFTGALDITVLGAGDAEEKTN